MKMAKASERDIEMAMELARFVEDISDGYCPKQACEDDESEEIEWLEDNDKAQLNRVIDALKNIVRQGSIFRVVFGLAALVDPRNELIDPNADTLEPHPKLERIAESHSQLLKALEYLLLEQCKAKGYWAPGAEMARTAIAKATAISTPKAAEVPA